jgi:hypothetical protein
LPFGEARDETGKAIFDEEVPVRSLIPIGIVLVIVWLLGLVVFKVAGFLIHLLVIVGVIMLIVGLFKRVSGGLSSRR